ncbi:MAG: zinc-binding dehydrogenase [Candidatus Omnitrophica bacterium]|nr:zinc-binding dehydrogenase [Candidatus Omnitrophota bacterium]
MKAIAIEEHGGVDKFKEMDLPIPQLGEHEILVKVHASAVNPVDTKIRSMSYMPRSFPMVLGFDVSGVVEALGSAVTQFKKGDEVFASPNLYKNGSNAEYVAVDARSAAFKPKTLSHLESAALPLVTLTAYEALHHHCGIRPNQTVLIHAGAGGVGHVAIQFAKLVGCRVITTAGRKESIEFCRDELKADEVIDYKSSNFLEEVDRLTDGKKCDIVFDTVGGDNFVQSLDAIAVNGKIVTILPVDSSKATEKLFRINATLHYEFMGVPTALGVNPEVQNETLTTVANLADSGCLKPHVSHTFPLDELAKAHEQQETGHTVGKIGIEVL